MDLSAGDLAWTEALLTISPLNPNPYIIPEREALKPIPESCHLVPGTAFHHFEREGTRWEASVRVEDVGVCSVRIGGLSWVQCL